MLPGRPPRLWLRLEQHDDKAFYANVPEVGDGLFLNANLAESSAASCASFIDRMAKPFAYDPISYRMENAEWLLSERGHGIEKRNYSRLWRKLARGIEKWTGEPLRDAGLIAALSDADLARYGRNSIDFQDRQLRDAWLVEAQTFVGMDLLFGVFSPGVYTAPYVIQRAGEGGATTSASVALARLTAELGKPRPTQAIIAMEPGVLDDVARVEAIARGFSTSGVRVAWIWTVGFSSLALADRPARFTNYTRLIRLLTDAGIEVGVLYGGYLAALLRFVGVRAISHGLMYGEVRGLSPAGRGPVASFYWPPLHRFLPYRHAHELVHSMSVAEYLERICACDICRQLVSEPGGLGDILPIHPSGSSHA